MVKGFPIQISNPIVMQLIMKPVPIICKVIFKWIQCAKVKTLDLLNIIILKYSLPSQRLKWTLDAQRKLIIDFPRSQS